MEEFYEDVLALLIINVPGFANSYDFCKVLSWKFKIINCAEISRRLTENKLIEIKERKPTSVTRFRISEIGFAYLLKHSDETKQYYLLLFENQKAFIDKLFEIKKY